MKKGLLIILISIIVTSVFAQNNWQHGKIIVSANGHYLTYEDGMPFFWLGDTGWELFHRLQLKEIATYLDNRKQKGFNVIQAAVLAEMDGLRKPNQYGEVPLRIWILQLQMKNIFNLLIQLLNLHHQKAFTWGYYLHGAIKLLNYGAKVLWFLILKMHISMACG